MGLIKTVKEFSYVTSFIVQPCMTSSKLTCDTLMGCVLEVAEQILQDHFKRGSKASLSRMGGM